MIAGINFFSSNRFIGRLLSKKTRFVQSQNLWAQALKGRAEGENIFIATLAPGLSTTVIPCLQNPLHMIYHQSG
jgi:hypothetical protein